MFLQLREVAGTKLFSDFLASRLKNIRKLGAFERLKSRDDLLFLLYFEV